MKVIPFEPEHALRIKLQDGQSDLEIDADYGREVIKRGVAWTGIEDGEIVFCCGRHAVGRKSVVWSLLSDRAGKHMLRITRIGLKLIALQSGELFAIVRSDFEQAHRWMVMLGFKFKEHVPGGLPGDVDGDIYHRMA